MKKVFLTFLLSIFAFQALAEIDAFEGGGYYWYKDPKDTEEEEQKPPEPPPKALAPSEVPLSVSWLQKNVESLREKAIDDPTQDNVANYMYAQRVLLDKSQQFAVMANQVVKMDPFLDEENHVPSASYSHVLFQRRETEGKKNAIEYMTQHGALWVFVDQPEKCSACDQYKNTVIQYLLKKYPFRYTILDVSTVPGLTAARNLGIKVTPATVYAKPKDPTQPDNADNHDATYILSEGLLSTDMIEDRLITAANTGKILPSTLSAEANPYQQGILTKDDFKGIPLGDPTAVMQALRNKINKN